MIDIWPIPFLVLLFLWAAIRFYQKKGRGFYPISTLQPFPSHSRWHRASLLWIVPCLYFLALFFLACALLAPQRIQVVDEVVPDAEKKGVHLYLVLDQSGSMQGTLPYQREGQATKLQRLKEVTADFIWGNPEQGLSGRPNDRIGLVTFARSAEVVIPLTHDRQQLKRALDILSPVQEKKRDGTAMGYAIYKTAHILALTREENSTADRAMILITDGFQNPHPDDWNNRFRSMGLEEAASFAAEQGIRLYLVTLDPKIMMDPYGAERRLLKKIAQDTGGEWFPVDEKTSLEKVYQEIDQLEKTPFSVSKKQVKVSYARDFLYLGACALLLSMLLHLTWLRVYVCSAD